LQNAAFVCVAGTSVDVAVAISGLPARPNAGLVASALHCGTVSGCPKPWLAAHWSDKAPTT
jgi:hypothetical protein